MICEDLYLKQFIDRSYTIFNSNANLIPYWEGVLKIYWVSGITQHFIWYWFNEKVMLFFICTELGIDSIVNNKSKGAISPNFIKLKNIWTVWNENRYVLYWFTSQICSDGVYLSLCDTLIPLKTMVIWCLWEIYNSIQTMLSQLILMFIKSIQNWLVLYLLCFNSQTIDIVFVGCLDIYVEFYILGHLINKMWQINLAWQILN